MLNRYSVITEKNPREIVLLRGTGCKWRKCRFCDYHLDFSTNEEENFLINKSELDKITGIFRKLEIVNSGSFTELDNKTMLYIQNVCLDKKIKELHFESHWSYRDKIPELKRVFSDIGITVKTKIGVETFDYIFRESYLDKGIDTESAEEIASYFDEICLLQGIPGQTASDMLKDIEIGLKYFERVCINIMTDNSKPIKSDKRVIHEFMRVVYPIYKHNGRVDILLDNTDFGVG